jgi:hypothetical protein
VAIYGHGMTPETQAKVNFKSARRTFRNRMIEEEFPDEPSIVQLNL